MNASPAKGESASTLTDIYDVEALKKLFNQDEGVNFRPTWVHRFSAKVVHSQGWR